MELLLIFTSGLLGSAHCLGMCGPFALTLGAASRNWRDNWWRQSAYSLGRVFTYTVLGAAAGYAGLRAMQWQWHGVHMTAVFSVVAGLILIYEGLIAAGLWRRRVAAGAHPCLAGSWLGTFLRGPRKTDVFLAGLATGFLPCGLVYGFLGLAAAASHVGQGALIMACFGLGTVPAMVAAGYGGTVLQAGLRRRLFALAAWSVILAGGMSVWRGVNYWHADTPAEACPFCQPQP